MPLRDRVYEFVSDGVDMIVATDHNVVCDYAPVIAELGVGHHLRSELRPRRPAPGRQEPGELFLDVDGDGVFKPLHPHGHR